MISDSNTKIEIINDLISKDKLLLAKQKLHNLINELNIKLNENTEETEQIQQLLHDIQTNKRFSLLEEEANATVELIKDFESDEGWNLVHSSDGVSTWYRHEENNPIHSVKMEGIIDAPIFNVCSIIYEIDLYSSWVPRLAESRLLHTSSRFKKNAYCRVSVPWPIADRDTCLYGFGVDMLEESSSVVVMVRSCKEDDEPHDHPATPHGVVRVDTKHAGFWMTPHSATTTLVKVISNTDPKMALIPYWLLNLVTKHLAHLCFTMLRSQAHACAQEGSPYHSRINSNPIYQELKDILKNYQGE